MTAGPQHIPRDGGQNVGEVLHEQLNATWSRKPGLIGWLSTVEIGRAHV